MSACKLPDALSRWAASLTALLLCSSSGRCSPCLAPTDPLYEQVGEAFTRQQLKLYGGDDGHWYGAPPIAGEISTRGSFFPPGLSFRPHRAAFCKHHPSIDLAARYGADLFAEAAIPSHADQLGWLHNVTRSTYRGMSNADPGARWMTR